MACFSASDRVEQLFRHARRGGGGAFAEPGVRPHYGPTRSFDIAHMDLRLDLEPADQRFSGKARLKIKPFPSFFGVIRLDLVGVTVEGVWNAAGEPLPWRHTDESLWIIALAGPVEIHWRGERPERGLYFTAPRESEPDHTVSAWTQCQDQDGHAVFPCLDHPSVKHPWSITLSAPLGFTLVSNGRFIETHEEAGRSVARYEVDAPMPAYLFSAIAAPLEIVEAPPGPVPVRYLVPPGRTGEVGLAFAKTPLMIEAFGRKTGVAFPWPRYDQIVVHDFIFGGMENVAATTMSDVLLVDAWGALEWDPDGLVSHELAHQWFGDLVTCQDWSQGWLNESWATFMETIWWEEDRAPEDVIWYRFSQARTYFAEASGRYARPIVSYDFREPIDVFDAHLYEKGAVILSSLRFLLGETAFWIGTKLYLERHAHGTVHTRHFQRAMEDASGVNLDRFFAEWIHAPGHPELKVSIEREKGLLLVGVTQTQSGEGVPQAYALPLCIEITLESGQVITRELSVAERERTWALSLDGEVVAVAVDPGFRLLSAMTFSGESDLLGGMLKGRDPVMAFRAGVALLAKGTASAVEIVMGAAREHPLHTVRAALWTEIGKLHTPQAREAMLTALSEEEDPRPRRTLATALGEYRDAEVATALISALDADEIDSWQLYAALLLALGKTRDSRAVGVLRQHLGVDSWAETVRQAALKALAATQDKSVLKDLIEASRPSRPDRIRGAAAIALGTLADQVEETRRAAAERLTEMVDEPGFRSKLMAVSALETAGDPGALAILSRVHRSAVEGRLKRAAYEAMQGLRAGRTLEGGLSTIRTQLDALSEENLRLKKRLDKLEKLSV